MNKKEWGNAIWYFMHTISYKLKEEHTNKANEIMNLFYNLCINTPCPYCSEHAKNTLNKLNIKKIVKKEDLIKVLFEFHNIVNKRINKELFTIEEFNDKYKKANTLNIVNYFFIIMNKKINNEKAMIYTMNRKIIVNKIYNYINNNKECFMQ